MKKSQKHRQKSGNRGVIPKKRVYDGNDFVEEIVFKMGVKERQHDKTGCRTDALEMMKEERERGG